MKHLIT